MKKPKTLLIVPNRNDGNMYYRHVVRGVVCTYLYVAYEDRIVQNDKVTLEFLYLSSRGDVLEFDGTLHGKDLYEQLLHILKVRQIQKAKKARPEDKVPLPLESEAIILEFIMNLVTQETDGFPVFHPVKIISRDIPGLHWRTVLDRLQIMVNKGLLGVLETDRRPWHYWITPEGHQAYLELKRHEENRKSYLKSKSHEKV